MHPDDYVIEDHDSRYDYDEPPVRNPARYVYDGVGYVHDDRLDEECE